jgi:hypothetical protein
VPWALAGRNHPALFCATWGGLCQQRHVVGINRRLHLYIIHMLHLLADCVKSTDKA